METKADFVLFSWALKSLWPVTTVMKLEDACSLEEKLWQTYLLFSCSVVSDSVTPWTTAHQTPLSFTVSRSLLKLMSIESMMPFNHLILCHPLLLWPSIFPSIRVFWVNSLHQVAKVLELQLHRQSFQWISGLISFRMDWFDLLTKHQLSKWNLTAENRDMNLRISSRIWTVPQSAQCPTFWNSDIPSA